jgi:hypothetical protein
MATSLTPEPGGPISGDEDVYRALNPKHLENGLPGDNHFAMSKSHALGDGISVGIASHISILELRSIEVLKARCGPEFGVAVLRVAEALNPVAALGIGVVQKDAIDWGIFNSAHAVITGYQLVSGDDRRRRLQDFQRHLVKLARKHFYPAGSNNRATSAD